MSAIDGAMAPVVEGMRRSTGSRDEPNAEGARLRPLQVLCISPTPTHPTTAGNRVRILNLLSALERWGHTVHFMHVARETGDNAAMAERWGPRFHPVPYTKPPRAESGARKWVRRARQIYDEDARHRLGVDDWYDPALDAHLAALRARVAFDVVIVEYVFMSKALLHFDAGVLKIIDSHDRFADRHRLFLGARTRPTFFSTSAAEEGRGLDRADVVLAIQESERAEFARQTRARVIAVGHLLDVAELAATPPETPARTMLFVGSANDANVHGMTEFLDACLPKIRSAMPEAELVVAGSVCDRLPAAPSCRRLGTVADLRDVYARTDVVVNPVRFGTGLNIKAMEALAMGRPLVTTSACARGLEEAAGNAIAVADTWDDFATATVDVLRNRERARAMRAAALDFAGQLNRRSLATLSDEFQRWRESR